MRKNGAIESEGRREIGIRFASVFDKAEIKVTVSKFSVSR